MGFTFKIDLTGLQKAEDEVRAAAERAVQAFSETGQQVMHETILAATTPTGEARVARGGRYAGRYETGRFYNAMTGQTSAEGDEYTGTIGALHDFEDYFRFQDEGTARIEAAGSLEAGFQAGVQAIRKSLESDGFRRG